MHHARYALILAGGSGTRLWPMSRAARPKQLLPLIDGRSLLEIAFQRLEGVVEPHRRLVCAGERQRRQVLRALKLPGAAYLGEPSPRDTLPALTWSTALIAERDPKAVIGVFTSDHLIQPESAFRRIVASGFDYVQRHPDTLLTFGISPTAPATGFGYLELGEPLEGPARRVRRFHEKPDLDTARRYVEAGAERYLWNSGMFIWSAGAFLTAVQRFQPEVGAGIQRILRGRGRRRRAALRALYPSLRKISVDYGIMEPASREPGTPLAAVPMPLQWRDIGSWPAYAEACPRDEQGNTVAGARGVLLHCRDSLLASSDPRHLIAAVGLEGLVVVHTPEATLICPKDRAQQIKDLLARLQEEHGSQYD